MKVAIPTEDRENVSEHFGRSPNFLVITVEGKEIVSREMRKKPGHEE
ncbi:MAG: dinitrogenase iron-molybdenum cofactor, partial [Thermoplasmata archaeon]